MTKYKPEYCQQLIKYFDIEPNYEAPVTLTTKSGTVIEKTEKHANPLPTFAGFCKKLHISRDTFHQWTKKYPELKEAYDQAKGLQEAVLVENAMASAYNTPFAIFFAKNNLGWTDKQELDHKSGGKKIGGFVVVKTKEANE